MAMLTVDFGAIFFYLSKVKLARVWNGSELPGLDSDKPTTCQSAAGAIGYATLLFKHWQIVGVRFYPV